MFRSVTGVKGISSERKSPVSKTAKKMAFCATAHYPYEFGGRTVDYTYDSQGRLTQEKMVGGAAGNRTIDYTYDLVGNRLRRNDWGTGLANYVIADGVRTYKKIAKVI